MGKSYGISKLERRKIKFLTLLEAIRRWRRNASVLEPATLRPAGPKGNSPGRQASGSGTQKKIRSPGRAALTEDPSWIVFDPMPPK